MYPQQNRPVPKKIVFLLSLREAHHHLYEAVKHLEDNSEYSYAVLTLLTASIMEQDHSSGSLDTNFADALKTLHYIDFGEEASYKLCTEVGEMIIQEVVKVIPDFGHARYNNRYEYCLRNAHDVQITVHSSVFTEDSGPDVGAGI